VELAFSLSFFLNFKCVAMKYRLGASLVRDKLQPFFNSELDQVCASL
jgi:hypothetical protein